VIARLEELRHQEHVKLVEAVGGDRFKRLTSEWKAFLNQPIARHSSAPNASRRLADVVYERAWRLSRKIGRRATDLDDATPVETVHELRVQAKKLRYLVDVMPGAGEDGDVKRVVVALKAFQRVLGDFNDAHVQAQRLIECRGAMAVTGAADNTVAAIGRLAEQARARGDQLRHDVVEQARRFGGRTVRSACRSAFKRAHGKAPVT